MSETWLNSTIGDGELFPSEYSVYRCDRNFNNRNCTRGGGVLIAVHNKFLTSQIIIENEISPILSSVDIVVVKIIAESGSVYIVNIYVPPSSTNEIYQELFETLGSLEFLHTCNVLIIGDFNIPNYVKFVNGGEKVNTKTSELNNFLSISSLSQYNLIPNHLGNILDLVLYNNICRVEKSLEYLVDEDMHHPALNIIFKMNSSHNLKRNFPTSYLNKYNYRKANYPLMYEQFANIDWTFLETFENPNDACTYFYGKLYNILDVCVPKQTSNYKRKYPPWFTRTIIKDIRFKSISLKKFKHTNDLIALEEFRRLRAKIKSDIKKSYRTFVQSAENDIKNNPKKFWGFVNSKKGSTSIANRMSYNEEILDTPIDILNGFADFFAKSYITSSTDTQFPEVTTLPNVEILNISSVSLDEVLIALRQIKNKMTIGPDHIPAFILRDCAGVFVHPLTTLLNICLRSSGIPDMWKLSKVRPVFKNGDKCDISNFRPISIICNFAKVFEKILHNKLSNHVSSLLTPNQHGFIAQRSTVTNLANIVQYIAEGIDERIQTDVVYTDFSKAFDRLDHGKLIMKLTSFGLSTPLIQLFTSYLTKRRQYVQFDGLQSIEYVATSGVPQGSNLGPLLFNVFINDITDVIDTKCLLFADDLKIFSKVRNTEDCQRLSQNLYRIEDWCTSHKLTLNVKKCKVMSFTLNKNPIIYRYELHKNILERPPTLLDLGITFDQRLSFNIHVENILKEANKMYGFIARNSHDFTSINVLKTMYYAFVRSKLEYASIIWSPSYQTHVLKVESVQRRFMKLLSYKLDNVYPEVGICNQLLLKRHGMNSLSSRRECYSLIFLFKLLHNQIDDSEFLSKIKIFVPRISSRATNTFYLPTPRTNVLKFSPLYRMCSNCNNMNCQLDIFYCSVSHIKSLYYC